MKKLVLCVVLIFAFVLTACDGGTTSSADTTTTGGDITATETSTSVTNYTGKTTLSAVTVTTKEVTTRSTTDMKTSASTTAAEKESESEMFPVETFQNPLFFQASADPCIVYHDGYYYCTFTEAVGITLYRSQSLATLFRGEKMTVCGLTDKVQGNIWAPELFYNPSTDRWYIYACGSTNGWDFATIRMFCLESKTNDPFSEYEFKGYTDPDLLAIDQTMFYDEVSKTLYTAYSEFTADGQVIMLAVMETPWTISDHRIRVSHPYYDWEKKGERDDKDSRVNEGPVFLMHDCKLSLIYSASGCWSQYYCLGMVEFTGNDFSVSEVMNSKNWNKSTKPVFSAANEVYGVGHCTFFISPDGTETWVAYHGMAQSDAGEAGRYAYAQKITFDEKGLPVLGEPLSRDTQIPVPSGESVK